LDVYSRPYSIECSHGANFSIHSDIEGVKISFLEVHKPSVDVVVPFFGAVDGCNDGLADGIHENDEAAVFMKVRAVIYDISD